MIHSPDEFYATVISLFTGLNFPTTTAVNFIEHENPAVTDEPEQVYDQDSDDEEVELAYIRRFNNQNRKPKPKFNYQSNDYPLANHNRSSYQQQPYNQRGNYQNSTNPFYQRNNNFRYQSKNNNFNSSKKFNPIRNNYRPQNQPLVYKIEMPTLDAPEENESEHFNINLLDTSSDNVFTETPEPIARHRTSSHNSFY